MSSSPLFAQPGATGAAPVSSEGSDLAERLRSPDGPQLLRQMQQQLDDMQARLRQQAGQGADSATYAQLQAALGAVDAARSILMRMPVTSASNFDSPMVQVPRPSARSTPWP